MDELVNSSEESEEETVISRARDFFRSGVTRLREGNNSLPPSRQVFRSIIWDVSFLSPIQEA